MSREPLAGRWRCVLAFFLGVPSAASGRIVHTGERDGADGRGALASDARAAVWKRVQPFLSDFTTTRSDKVAADGKR